MPTKNQLMAQHKGFYFPMPEALRRDGDAPDMFIKLRMGHDPRGYDLFIHFVGVGRHSETTVIMDPRGSFAKTFDARRFSAKTWAEHLAFIEANKDAIVRLFLAGKKDELLKALQTRVFPAIPTELPRAA